ncbi:MAG: cysteine desulfurase family protein [Candidatus Dormibacteria bacterium]
MDNAASTAVDPAVLAAMLPWLQGGWGNPSSQHQSGRSARQAVDRARDQVAQHLDCLPSEVVFTSGGSEGDNLALRGVAAARPGCHLVVSAVEHHAVLETARRLEAAGHPLTVLEVEGGGVVAPGRLRAALRRDTGLVSVMLANNETGVVNDIRVLAGVVHENSDALMHTDAVQAVGKVRVSFRDLGVDLLTLTAHKLHGPKGAGALLIRRDTELDAQVTGGEHERGFRAGTENVAGIVGLGAALETAAGTLEDPEVGARRDRLEELVESQLPGLIRLAGNSPRLPGMTAWLVPGVLGEDLVLGLDAAGVCASAGPACAAGSVEPSHVVAALGHSEPLALGLLRLSLSRFTTDDEVERAATAVVRVVGQLRRAPTMAV